MLAQRDKELEIGLIISTCGHALVALLFLSGFLAASHDFGQPTIYSITFEGGEKLGGISQIPDDKQKTQIAPPKKTESKPPEKTLKEEKKEVKKEEKKEEPKKEPKAEEKKPEVSLKEEKKEKPKPEPKKVEEKKPQQTGTDVNKQLQQAMQRYLGESTDAGGTGFGAGALGGTAMGGGVVMPEAFHRYRLLLKDTIQSGWRWIDTSAPLIAEATFQISPEGDISNVTISKSSGLREFDQSVQRAILKASPLPPPPPEVYKYFRSIRMIFDPKDL